MTMAESIKYLLETKKAHDRHFIVGPNKVKIGVVTDLVVKCSDVLKAMLCDSEIRERGDVLMPDHHPDTIIIFLKFAYGAADSVTLSSDLRNWPAQTVLQVVDFAEKYNVAPLKQIAFNHFDHTLDNMNDFFLALHCVALYDATSLESAVLKVVQEKTQIVLAHAHFLLIDVESLILILKQNVLNVTEVELLKACLTWAVHKGRRAPHEPAPSVVLNDMVIDEVLSTKFLGIHIDKGLSWEKHLDVACARMSSGIYTLRKLAEFCGIHLLKIAYYGLVYPHMSYGITLWGGCANVHFQRCFVLQRKAVRIVAKMGIRKSCRDYFRELDLFIIY
ncbi:BTB/POZ domain-containing protein 6-B-like isoform X3 [Homalodisca vitripennis]|uniref:BTB/POZ domain-containing protein 6-B-like isoform X3 n=1 Tax=Homalodisca vitripennis TaxID=197043 RepID=UPI001EEC27B0|nr:BTB/POZ domain-containing protein 6-B-like isoform X3 [Homalodisca vitripennis]